MNSKKVVEAVLFTSSKPVTASMIRKITGLRKDTVSEAVNALNKEYEERDSAMEIICIDNSYYMQVKKNMIKYSIPVSKPKLPSRLIRTLALIAYHQPVKQSLLKDMIGNSIYDHISELKKTGLIYRKKEGNTYMISLTKKFTEYFGINVSDRKGIMQWITANLGTERANVKSATIKNNDIETK